MNDALKGLLSEEFTAVSQYMVHSEMCANWCYENLHKHFEKRGIDDMKHAKKLIGRILFLEGTPIVITINKELIGSDTAKQLENERLAEVDVVKDYNDAIVLAGEVRDFAAREVLESILNDEDRHLDGIEECQDQISHMTLPPFLATQH